MILEMVITASVILNPSSHLIIHISYCTLEEFRAYFEQFGKVLSAEVLFNRETHKSRGFGFIVFESEHSADMVCLHNDHVIDDKLVR